MTETKVKKLGRPRKTEQIKRTKELIAKGLTYREIMKVLEVGDTKTIYRWAHYVL